MQSFVERVLDALSLAGVEFVIVGGVSAVLDLDGEDLDLLAEMSGIGGYDDVVGSALELEVGGRVVKVLSFDRLIATKRAAGRAKDLAMLPLLEATLEATRPR